MYYRHHKQSYIRNPDKLLYNQNITNSLTQIVFRVVTVHVVYSIVTAEKILKNISGTE